jgi:hypothetical protein
VDRYLNADDSLSATQVLGCDKDPRSIRFNRIQKDTEVFVRSADELKGTLGKNIFNNDALFFIPSLDLASCGWPCVTISAMAFYKPSKKLKKGSCIEKKMGETGHGFGNFEDYLGNHPSVVMLGETVRSK